MVARGRTAGFTFLELLATVVLIAIIMPVAMHSIGLCTRLGGVSRRRIEAASLARTQMAELVATGDWTKGDQKGSFGDDWPAFEWEAVVTTWTDPTMRQLDVTVTWLAQGKERGVTLSTLLYPEEE
jgi:prepilin-type N-terminal cleavage/methylation domain-containing protein